MHRSGHFCRHNAIKMRTAAVARLLLGLYLLASATTLHAVTPLVPDDADTVNPEVANDLNLSPHF
jgi:hypothetical protein